MGLKQEGRSKCGNPNKEEEEEDIMKERERESWSLEGREIAKERERE